MEKHEIESLLANQRPFHREVSRFTGYYTPFEDLMQEAAIEQWLVLADGHTPELAAWRARKAVMRAGMRELWTGQETGSGGKGKDIMRTRGAFHHIESYTTDYKGTTGERGQLEIEWISRESIHHDNLDGVDINSSLREALLGLTARQKEVVFRKFWLQETFPEIAEAMGLSKKQAENTWYKQVQPLLQERLLHLRVDDAA